jgi:membrane protease YdiL (CAAX protease family)
MSAFASSIHIEEDRITLTQRWFSLLEFVVGGAIVIAYNVFHVLWNEVPILFVLGLVSIKLRNGSWNAMGLGWPASWRKTILFALGAAALRILLSIPLDAITAHFWPAAKSPSGMNDIAGHGWIALRWIALVWTFAAFGEEISYRGYLVTRAAESACRTRLAYWIAVLAVSVLFGYGHYYKGPAGMLDSGMAGLILGAAFLLSGRNLWVSILAHGFIDTFGLVCVFFGWAN